MNIKKNEKWQCWLPSSYNHERREGLVMQYHTILFSTLILHQEVCIIETPDSLFSLINSGESLTRWYSWCWWISHSLNGSVYEFAKFKEDIYRIQYRIVVCVSACVCICVCVFYYFRVGKNRKHVYFRHN